MGIGKINWEYEIYWEDACLCRYTNLNTWHKESNHTQVKNDRNIFKAISESVGTSVLIACHNNLSNVFTEILMFNPSLSKF